jgi:D-tyrosyl-tRNA(Tyr) deacylase
VKVLVQRVTRASVTVNGEVIGKIGLGLLVFVGVEKNDDEATSAWFADRVHGLRIFQDDKGHMNLALPEVNGSALVVSQFTLAGSTRSGRRPSFGGAAAPEVAEKLYEHFADALRKRGIPVETGKFRADMKVELLNDGPVTFMIDPPEGM